MTTDAWITAAFLVVMIVVLISRALPAADGHRRHGDRPDGRRRARRQPIAAFVSMLMFCVWWYFGKLYCTAFYYVKGERGRISMKYDVTAFGEKGFAQGIK